MRLLLIILIAFISNVYCQETGILRLEDFSGKITQIEEGKIPPQNCVDCLNVYTDTYKNIIKRKGSIKYNATALADAKNVKRVYNYITTLNKNYLIVNSSQSVFALDNTSVQTLVGGLTLSAVDDYTTAKLTLYRDNGVDGLGSKWDGTTYTPITVLNSTQMISGQYIEYWNNRLFKVPKNSSLVYYSRVNDPDYFDQVYQYINVNYQDGDTITGMMIWADRLIVTKKYAVYEIYESQPGVFLTRRLYNGIGCLYNQTMDVLNGYPVWVSARGIEQFDGNNFVLLSESNYDYIRSLPQFSDSVLSYTETKNEFGLGTIVDIDTVTVNGMELAYSTGVNQQNIGGTQYTLLTATMTLYQTFISSMDGYITNIDLYIKEQPLTVSGSFGLFGGELTVGTTVSRSVLNGTDSTWYTIPFPLVKITSGTTYTLSVNIPASSSFTGWYKTTANNYSRGTMQDNHVALTNIDGMFKVVVAPSSGTFTSQVINFDNISIGTWQSWNRISGTNGGSEIIYRVRTGTATTTVVQAPWTTYNYSDLINQTTGPYIQYMVIMTSFQYTLPSFTITGSGDAFSPSGKTYNKRYYVALSTDTSTGRNNVVWCYQRDNSWTVFNGINVGDFAVMKNNLYFGDSGNTGQVYQTDVDNTYTDDGTLYDSFWKSKQFDMDTHLQNKIFRTVWVYGTMDSNSIRFGWHIDNGSLNDRIMNNDGQAIQFPAWTKGRDVQFEIHDLDSHSFSFKRFELTYTILKPRVF